MAQRDGAAVDVEPIGIDRQLFEAGEHLRGEGFIQLDEVDLIERQAGEGQRLADRRHGADAETLRLDTCRCEGHEPAERGQPALFCARRRHHDHRRGPVARLR